jgi:putative redox protein
MVTPKMKTVVTMRLEGHCPSHSRTDIRVRDTGLTIDEPVERGGTNQGPSPTETLMGALAGCTNVIAQKCAEKHGVAFKSIQVDIVSKFDRRGVTLMEEIDLPFDDIEVHITVTTDADAAAMDKVKTDLPKFCPVSKVMRQAGAKVTDIWTINSL